MNRKKPGTGTALVPERIQQAILLLRGHKIMLDFDLAGLRFRFGTSRWDGRRYRSYAFTKEERSGASRQLIYRNYFYIMLP